MLIGNVTPQIPWSSLACYSGISISICIILKRQRYGSSGLINVIDRVSAGPNQSHVPPLICINYRDECRIFTAFVKQMIILMDSLLIMTNRCACINPESF